MRAKRRTPIRHLAALALGAALLTACTGTEEVGDPVNLAVQDGTTTLRVTPLPGGTTTVVTTNAPITDLATLESGRRLGVSFPGQLEVRGADASTLVRTIGNPAPDYNRDGQSDFAPCYRQVKTDQTGVRVALLSDPGQAGDNAADFGCDRGRLREQWIAVYQTNGTLLFTARLPTPLSLNPNFIHLALVGDTLYVARQFASSPETTSEIDRVRADANPNDGTIAPRLDILAVNAPFIRDLAVLGNSVYAATDNGVFTLTDAGLGSGAVGDLTGRADRLWSSQNSQNGQNQGILAAWNGDSSGANYGTLTLRYRSGDNFTATLPLTGLQSLRDLVFSPDGYLYAILPGTVYRYDIAGFGRSPNFRPPNPDIVGVGVQNGQNGAYAVP